MTEPIPGDVEAAVERLKLCGANPGAFGGITNYAISVPTDDLRTLLASHAALIEQARLDGEALEEISNGYLVNYTGKWVVQTVRARLQAREGGGS